MKKRIVAEKISPLVCINHRSKPASYKILSEEKETIFLCGECFSSFDADEKIVSDMTIKEGRFKSSSVVTVKSNFAEFHWKDFGKNRKNLRFEAEESARIKSCADEAFCHIFFLSSPEHLGDIKFSGKKYDIWYSEFFDILIATGKNTRIPWFILNNRFEIIAYFDIRNHRRFES